MCCVTTTDLLKPNKLFGVVVLLRFMRRRIKKKTNKLECLESKKYIRREGPNFEWDHIMETVFIYTIIFCIITVVRKETKIKIKGHNYHSFFFIT